MMRQGEARNEDEAAHGLSLIALQMWSVYRPRGGQDPRQIIYNVRLAESYVGRTQATHPAANNSGGLAIRWSQHVRQLIAHARAKETNRRTRYRILLGAGSSRFLRAWCFKDATIEEAQKIESFTMILTEPKANNLLRTPGVPVARTQGIQTCREGKPKRARRPLSMNEKLARLDAEVLHTKEDALYTARLANVGRDIEKETRREGAIRKIREQLEDPLRNWYQDEQRKHRGTSKGQFPYTP